MELNDMQMVLNMDNFTIIGGLIKPDSQDLFILAKK